VNLLARPHSSLPPKLTLLFALVCAARTAQAKPGWADKGDSQSEAGHGFVCEGEGKNEEDALAAAQAICNDKICKVCGVEVESVTTTSETLKGVDLQRKVIERCRRVRKSETQVKRKSADCEDSNCSAWIEVFYSAADEKAECPGYTKEDFADPALCETDIEAFRGVKDRTAESFRERTRRLDDALIHCARIDVRPTPAILALDAKLRAGMDAFEFTEEMQHRLVEESQVGDPWERGAESRREAAMQDRPWWAWYLTTYPPLRQGIAEAKLLTDRLQLVRDYVANRALVFDVIEAVRTRELDTPAGIERLRAALEKAPIGGQYGSQDVHFDALSAFNHPKSDTEAIGALLRKLYDPRKLDGGQDWTAALFFHGDDRCTADEWNWIYAASETRLCVPCLRVLLEAKDHGSKETRLQRFQQAYALAAPRMKGKNPEVRAFTELVGHNEAGLLVAALPLVPPTVQQQLGWEFVSSAVYALERKRDTPEEASALLALAVSLLQRQVDRAEPKQLESECSALAERIKVLEQHHAQTAPLGAQACTCLTGPLRDQIHLVNRDDLFEWAEKQKLACLKGLPRPPE